MKPVNYIKVMSCAVFWRCGDLLEEVSRVLQLRVENIRVIWKRKFKDSWARLEKLQQDSLGVCRYGIGIRLWAKPTFSCRHWLLECKSRKSVQSWRVRNAWIKTVMISRVSQLQKWRNTSHKCISGCVPRVGKLYLGK